MNTPVGTKMPKIRTAQMRRAGGKLSPLSYERVAILMAVAAGPIDKARIGAIILRVSTAYFLINELEQTGYLERNGSYDLTDKGWRALQNELQRIEYQRLVLKKRLHT